MYRLLECATFVWLFGKCLGGGLRGDSRQGLFGQSQLELMQQQLVVACPCDRFG